MKARLEYTEIQPKSNLVHFCLTKYDIWWQYSCKSTDCGRNSKGIKIRLNTPPDGGVEVETSTAHAPLPHGRHAIANARDSDVGGSVCAAHANEISRCCCCKVLHARGDHKLNRRRQKTFTSRILYILFRLGGVRQFCGHCRIDGGGRGAEAPGPAVFWGGEGKFRNGLWSKRRQAILATAKRRQTKLAPRNGSRPTVLCRNAVNVDDISHYRWDVNTPQNSWVWKIIVRGPHKTIRRREKRGKMRSKLYQLSPINE